MIFFMFLLDDDNDGDDIDITDDAVLNQFMFQGGQGYRG